MQEFWRLVFFFGRNKTDDFSPEAPLPAGKVEADSGEQEELVDIPEASDEVMVQQPTKEPAEEETYPKVVEESEDEVVVELTPQAEEITPETPEKPETQADVTNSEVKPSYQPEETKVPPTEEQKEAGNTGTPQPGSTNAAGEVYVPGFGWTMPSTVEQIEMHNDGDPNKMVGDM